MSVSLFALGGLGEIGMNCLVLDSGNEAVMIDAGLMFPDDGMLGIDYIIPDFSAVEKMRDRLSCLFLTHGHDDHIGAVPFLLKEFSIPVYGTELTLELLRGRLSENMPPEEVDLRILGRKDVVKLSDFTLETFPVCHSIPEGVGFIINTRDGVIVHTGDFKIDSNPPDGVMTDLERVSRAGAEGVSLLLSDSTNVENFGRTMSESYVKRALDDIIRNAPGRVIVSMFSSNILRLADTINSAHEAGRKVAVTGRSMEQNLQIGKKLGYVDRGMEDPFINIEHIGKLDDASIVILTTGSQGEHLSALSLMSRGQHKYVTLKEGDSVVLSSRFIPGNERAIYRLINNLFKRGARVLYQAISDVHVSGHGARKEQQSMIMAARPSSFVPVHGEYRHLVQHSQLAMDSGVPVTFVLGNGQLLSLDEGTVKRGGEIITGKIFVDGKGVGDVREVVLKERRNLSRHGVVIAVIGYNAEKGAVTYGPQINCLGLTEDREGDELISEAKEEVLDTIEREGLAGENDGEGIEEIRRSLRRFFNRKLERKPIVIPVVIDL